MAKYVETEYLIEPCLYCGSYTLVSRRTIPKGMCKLDNQVYLVCLTCKRGQMKFKELTPLTKYIEV